jgi:hypothetical protein
MSHIPQPLNQLTIVLLLIQCDLQIMKKNAHKIVAPQTFFIGEAKMIGK